jgi:regulator of sigma E protease
MPFKVEPGEPPQFVLTGVGPGSAAEKAGLKAGDRLVAFQGKPIADERQLRLELLAASGEVAFQVERAGAEEPLEIRITPAGQPVRIGFTWRVDEAEPQAAILTQIIYGSAAHVAGLRLRDRVCEVNGQSFSGSDELMKLLLSQQGPIDLVIERGGKVQTIRLEPLASS